jgi:hypothetical protein
MWMVSFTPRLLHSQGKIPRSHWIGSWMGPRTGLDAAAKRNIPSLLLSGIEYRPSGAYRNHYTDWATSAHIKYRVSFVNEHAPHSYIERQMFFHHSLGVKRPGREADHSPPSSPEVKNTWSSTSTHRIRLHGVVLSTGTTLPLSLNNHHTQKI